MSPCHIKHCNIACGGSSSWASWTCVNSLLFIALLLVESSWIWVSAQTAACHWVVTQNFQWPSDVNIRLHIPIKCSRVQINFPNILPKKKKKKLQIIFFATSSLTLMFKLIIEIHKQACCIQLPFLYPFTHNNEKAEAVNRTCLAPHCGPVHWLMCCPVFQGRDELGDHAGGASEKDHEQHTDYESPDAASPRHGCPGVTNCDDRPRQTGAQKTKKTELIWSSAWDVTGIIVKVNGHLLCLTLPAVSGVKSFLCSSVKDCGPPLQRALKGGKGQKTTTKKETTWTRWLSFYFLSFLFFLEALMNSTTYQMAHWKGVFHFRFFNLMNDLSAHHGYGFPLKRTKKTKTTCLLAVVSVVSFSNLLIFFSSATVTYCGTMQQFFWRWQQGKLSSIQTEQNFLGADSKVLFVLLTHAGLFELFAVTRVFLHVLLKWKWYPHTLVWVFWHGFNLSIFSIKEFPDECNTEEANCSSNQQTFISE